jgi:hypothetical protein
MKLICAFLFAALVGFLSYSAGQQGKAESIKAVADVALSWGYVCGAFRDPSCIDSFKQ